MASFEVTIMADERNKKKDKKVRAPFPVSYTLGEELCNSISHGVGAVFAVLALVLMLVQTVPQGDPWKTVSAAVYGASLILLYTMSTLYHAFKPNLAKRVFRIFDHCTIYFLIAGTYTPYTLNTLRGPWGWSLFGVVWGITLLGVVLNAISIEKFKVFSSISYIVMGWAIILAFKPLYDNLASSGLWLLIGGGVCYTLGIIFYALKKWRYMHSIWHAFVLAGTVMHFFSIYLYVLA